jgi:hypothetical protein
MTAFAAIFDNDLNIKNEYIQYINKYFARHYSGINDKIDIEDIDCQLNISPSIPVSFFEQGDLKAFVLGHIDASGSLQNNHAKIIVDHFRKMGLQDLAKYSGYFLAIKINYYYLLAHLSYLVSIIR